jgi:FixJ family two-component response regulator
MDKCSPREIKKGPVDKKKHVIVVDDHPAVRAAIANLLASAGYAVATYSSAEELLSGQLDGAGCLILDLGLPRMNGFDLQASLASRRCPPVIFVTSEEDPHGELRARALKAGALEFLRKPFGADELLNAILRA